MADPIAEYLKGLNSGQLPQATPSATPPDVLKSDPDAYANFHTQAAIGQMQRNGLIPTVHDAVGLYSKHLADAQDAQRAIAQEQEKRTHLTPEEAQEFGASKNAWDVLDQIQGAWNQTTSKLGWQQGPLGGNFAGISGALGDPNVRSYNTLVHTARPILNSGIMHEGRAQAGEKANIQGFEANLPTFTDTPASAQAKLDVLRHMVANTTNTSIDTHIAAGRDLSGIYPMIAPIRAWDQNQQHPSQVGTPTAAGPVLNGASPEARALLTKSFPQAQTSTAGTPATAQVPQTSPANQPVPQQPAQQQGDSNWFSKIFSNGPSLPL